MTALSRRFVLAGVAAATVAPAVAPILPARAAAPVSGVQAPGFYRYKVGSIEVTVVTEGVTQFPVADGFVLNATKQEVNAALAAAFFLF